MVFLKTDLFGKAPLSAIPDYKTILLGVILFAAMQKYKKIHPAAFIGISAIVGIIFSFAE